MGVGLDSEASDEIVYVTSEVRFCQHIADASVSKAK